MPRNGSGQYVLPTGNPVVSNTVIEADWANNTLADIANEMTDSLSRNGEGGMLAALRIADGSVGVPGLAFSNETTTGLYRSGAGEWWLTVGGVAVAKVSATGLTAPAGKVVTITDDPTNATDAANKGYVDDQVAPVIGYANFYLGPKSSDPTVNNSGGALTEGTTYWSTTLDQMRVYNGTNWVPMPTISSLVGQTFSGDGSDTTFTLANPTGNSINLEVFISGVRQVPTTDYSVSSTTLTFTTAPPSGTDNIFVRYAQLGTITDGAGSIVYTPAGTGAVATTVQSKLRESVSVKDFGAVGTSDDTAVVQAAITAAVAAGVKLRAAAGTYTVNALTIPGSLVIEGDGIDQTFFVAKTTIGQNNMFTASGVDGITVTGCKFDMRNDAITPVLTDDALENIFLFTSCSNVKIQGNHFIRALNRFIRFNATALAETINVYVHENLFENGSRGGVENRRYGQNIHVYNNRMTNVVNSAIGGVAAEKSISVSGTVGVWIEGNYVLQSNTDSGTIIVEYIDRQSEAVNILNNRVYGSGENGIKVGASVDVRVEGNSCLYSTNFGIYIEGCYDTIVQNNFCSESGNGAIRIYEDGDTGRTNKNIRVVGNTFHNSNTAGNTVGVVGVAVNSTDSYHISCRQSAYVYIYENRFIDDGAGTAGGIYIGATDYYIERNDMIGLKAAAVTFTNTSSVSSDRFNVVNNRGSQTTDRGLATILNGQNTITVTPDTVVETADKRMQASLNDLLTGTAAYWCILDAANQTFTIRTRTSAHGAANVTADTKFTWDFSVANAIGIFGKTTR
jgi:parallel beta-helix repeat protein